MVVQLVFTTCITNIAFLGYPERMSNVTCRLNSIVLNSQRNVYIQSYYDIANLAVEAYWVKLDVGVTVRFGWGYTVRVDDSRCRARYGMNI